MVVALCKAFRGNMPSQGFVAAHSNGSIEGKYFMKLHLL